jgi:FtsP/CotA-like multicopper oxidase with cupredoxin domain
LNTREDQQEGGQVPTGEPPVYRLSRRAMLGAAALGAPALWAARAEAAGNPNYHPPVSRVPLPWAKLGQANLPPSVPGEDYAPVLQPNVKRLEYKVVDGVKVFHLVTGEFLHEIVPGLQIYCWGFNGGTPGPLIEGAVGDRVRIYVTNGLREATSVHWHALILPNGMDGVGGVTQPIIEPGQTFAYEFILPTAGTFMYHSHVDDMVQQALGMTGMFVVHERGARRPDRDFALLLHEWAIEAGAMRPDPLEMTDFNVLTINAKAAPATHPLIASLGEHVRIRIGNLSPMSHHPIHLHGYTFRVTETDGGPVPASAQWPETTVLVPVGSTRTIEFVADNPGDWLMHCHMTHHMMNQMGHGLENPVGVDPGQTQRKIQRLLPDYMTMGVHGMDEMAHMKMAVPANSIPMLGIHGPFNRTSNGGMLTILKVREQAEGFEDPGWYEHPKGTVAWLATEEELRRDGISTA